ncbi:hypothetical protein GJ496_002877 [Pomphorhynchus laevis]|nr:hypothetical protein GJ496_002877 [Pomphorhynchus laevis]
MIDQSEIADTINVDTDNELRYLKCKCDNLEKHNSTLRSNNALLEQRVLESVSSAEKLSMEFQQQLQNLQAELKSIREKCHQMELDRDKYKADCKLALSLLEYSNNTRKTNFHILELPDHLKDQLSADQFSRSSDKIISQYTALSFPPMAAAPFELLADEDQNTIISAQKVVNILNERIVNM